MEIHQKNCITCLLYYGDLHIDTLVHSDMAGRWFSPGTPVSYKTIVILAATI